MIESAALPSPDRRFRDLERALRAVSAEAVVAVAACRCILRRMDDDLRRVAEARHAE